jgi:hypothetical protein
MGGRGSGRRAGLRADTTEDYLAVDLAGMKRKGCLRTGYAGRITWSRNGAVFAFITYRVEEAGLRLIYRTRSHGGAWQDIDELIPFASTATRYSGQRRWLTCLSCGRRCRIVYGGSRFRCRRCYRLKYVSQYEPLFGRAASKAHAIRARLGAFGSLDDPFPPKPKGMHWKTYRRLEAEDERLQEPWAAGAMRLMMRFR